MRKRHRLLILSSLILAWVGAAVAAKAGAPNSITLLSFTVTPQDSAADIEWVTGTETDTAGFKIQRSTDGIFFTDVFPFIIAEGNATIGATYNVTDNDAENGETYTYKLVEIVNNGAENEAATATVTINAPTPTPTDIVIGGGGGNPTSTPPPPDTPTATATATATATMTPTAEPNDAPSPTPTSSSTPQPTATASATQAPTQTPPPATDDPSSESSGQALAQVAVTNTPDGGYPGPTEPAATATSDDGYPGAQPPSPTRTPANPTPYPAVTETSAGASPPATIAVIGGEGTGIPLNATVQPNFQAGDDPDAAVGRAYLWGGFIVAFLIFVTAVIGSILLFTRKKE